MERVLITDETIFLVYKKGLESMGRVPKTKAKNCIKVSLMPLPETKACALLITGVGPDSQMLSTAVGDRPFSNFMTDLEHVAEPYRKQDDYTGWSIGRKENCPAYIKDQIHELGAHRIIFINDIDLPKFWADYKYRERKTMMKKEKGLKVVFTRMMQLDILERMGDAQK